MRRNVSPMPEPIDPAAAPSPPQIGATGRSANWSQRARLRRRPRPFVAVRRFWNLAWQAGLTGLASMVAYNMLLGVIPVALLGLFIAGQVLSSQRRSAQRARTTSREVFPGTTREHAQRPAATRSQNSTTSTGVLALIASVWLGSSFWGALDTSFTRIYGCTGRTLAQAEALRDRDGRRGARVHDRDRGRADGPGHPARRRRGPPVRPRPVADLVYAISLGVSIALLFGCLVADLLARPEPVDSVARGVARGARRDARDRGRRLRLPGLPVEHLDDRPVRDDDRVRADRRSAGSTCSR